MLGIVALLGMGLALALMASDESGESTDSDQGNDEPINPPDPPINPPEPPQYRPDEVIDGNHRDNELVGADGLASRIVGFGGNDVLVGYDLDASAEASHDQLFGGAGNDAVFGDDGDTLTGGAGTDIFGVIAPRSIQDPVVIADLHIGGDENDVVVLLNAENDIMGYDELLQQSPSVQAAENSEDSEFLLNGEVVATIKGVSAEALQADSRWIGNVLLQERFAGDDLMQDSLDDDNKEVDNRFYTWGGDDTIIASSGTDFGAGGQGDDMINLVDDRGISGHSDLGLGQSGDDTLRGDSGDTLSGGAGNDTFEVVIQSGMDPVVVKEFDYDPDRGFHDQITLLNADQQPISAEDLVANLTGEDTDDGWELTYDGQLFMRIETMVYEHSDGHSPITNIQSVITPEHPIILAPEGSHPTTNLGVTSATGTGITVNQEMMTGNMVYTINTEGGEVQPTYTAAINELGIEHVRYPAGQGDSLRSGDEVEGVDWLNVASLDVGPDGETSLRPELTKVLDWARETGPDGDPIRVTLVIPVKAIPTEDYPDFAKELEDWAEKLATHYPDVIESIELGNEYWAIGETEYATRASMAAVAVNAGMLAAGLDEDDQPDVIVQMASPNQGSEYHSSQDSRGFEVRNELANQAIIDNLSDEAKAVIDGVVEHSYWNENNAEFQDSSQEMNFVNKDLEIWRAAFDKDLSVHVTEWNLKNSTLAENGVRYGGTIHEHFENLLELGADSAHTWAVQHNTSTDLAGGHEEEILLDDQGRLLNTIRGAIYQNIAEDLVGAELLELEVDGDGPYEINGYETEDAMHFYVSSRVDDAEIVSVDFSDIIDFEFEVEAQVFTMDQSTANGIHWSSKAGGFVATDNAMVDGDPWYYNEHDVRAAYRDLSVAGTEISVDLNPYETAQITFNKTS